MINTKCLINPKKLKGKIIKKVTSSISAPAFGIFFTDDTYCIINAFQEREIVETRFSRPEEFDAYALHDLELLTDAAFTEWKKKDKIQRETVERAEYKRLKLKFGME